MSFLPNVDAFFHLGGPEDLENRLRLRPGLFAPPDILHILQTLKLVPLPVISLRGLFLHQLLFEHCSWLLDDSVCLARPRMRPR